MWDLIFLTIPIVVFFLCFLAYRYFYQNKNPDKKITLLWFEQVGNDKVFKGIRTAYEKNDDKLGIYYYNDKEKTPLSDLSNTDFFPDAKYGKALMVCKFADDTVLPMARLKGDEEWFRKEGKELVRYEEPIGLTQEDREASRFNRSFQQRMHELMGEQKSWLERFAPYLTVGVVGIILMIGFVHQSNKSSETQKYIADTFVLGANEYKKSIEDPLFAEQLMERWERRTTEQTAPPD